MWFYYSNGLFRGEIESSKNGLGHQLGSVSPAPLSSPGCAGGVAGPWPSGMIDGPAAGVPAARGAGRGSGPPYRRSGGRGRGGALWAQGTGSAAARVRSAVVPPPAAPRPPASRPLPRARHETI